MRIEKVNVGEIEDIENIVEMSKRAFLTDINVGADDLKIYNDNTNVKVLLDEITLDAESSNKEILKDVEDEIVNFRQMINVNFSYEIDDENYHVIQ